MVSRQNLHTIADDVVQRLNTSSTRPGQLSGFGVDSGAGQHRNPFSVTNSFGGAPTAFQGNAESRNTQSSGDWRSQKRKSSRSISMGCRARNY